MKMELETVLAAALVVTMGMGTQARADTTPTAAVQSQTRYYYVDTDANKNGTLEANEFTTYVYKRWDRDMDGFLSDEEWQLSSVDWYRPYSDVEYKNYTYWDKDGDKRLDTNEFDTLMSETALYSRWDMNGDGILQQDEYASATFAMYDDDKNGQIDLVEWKNSIL
jgi:hypothetical protein